MILKFGKLRPPLLIGGGGDGGRRWGAMHEGLDLAADTGTPIVAAQDGRVEYSGWCGGYGRFVEIVHDDGFITRCMFGI